MYRVTPYVSLGKRIVREQHANGSLIPHHYSHTVRGGRWNILRDVEFEVLYQSFVGVICQYHLIFHNDSGLFM